MKNLTTTIVFCALIGALTVASTVNPVREYSETENRALAQRPKFSFKTLFDGQFTANYEEFITDQFVARDMWITLKTRSELALGKKDSNGVYFGEDGYLFEKHEVPKDVNRDRSESNLRWLGNFLENKADSYNIRVMIAPTASLIHADKLPANAPVWDQAAFLDKVGALDDAVDARDVLMAHNAEDIYYKTDHHWTTLGAYYAYTALCESLGLTPLPEDTARVTLAEDFVGTLAAKVNLPMDPETIFTYDTDVSVQVDYNLGMKVTDTLIEESYLTTRDKYGAFLDGNQPIADVQTDVKNGKTLLVIKDSYAHCMAPLLATHYERLIFLDLRHFNGTVSSYLDMLAADGGTVDDILILYNAENFTEDRYVGKLQ